MPTKKVLEKQLARLEEEIDELKDENEELKKANETARTVLKDQENRIEKLLKIKGTFERMNSDLRVDLAKAKTENKKAMKDMIEMNDKIRELTHENKAYSQKVPKGAIVAEQFKGITNYVFEGKSLSREAGWYPNREALNRAMNSQKSSILSQGATDVKQKIRREVTFEFDA